MRVGERVLLPAVREASRETIIVADGFSCREQIAQSTDREALHLAQVLQMALSEESAGELPERRYPSEAATQSSQAISSNVNRQPVRPTTASRRALSPRSLERM